MSFLREVQLDETEFPPFANAKKAFGFIPKLFRAQTLRPDIIEAETRLIGATLLQDGALARAQKEYIFLVCSAANLSTYCVTAHCEIVRALGIRGPEPEKIAVDHLRTNLPIPDKALLNFALKLTREPVKVTKSDIGGLRTYGFNDEQILEAVVITALAKFANLLSLGLGAEPDFEPRVSPQPRE